MYKASKLFTGRGLRCMSPAGISAVFIMVLAAGLCGTGVADAYAPQSSAALNAASVNGLAGNSVDLAVTLAPGAAGVCTLQFDLQLPASLGYVSTATGSAAAAAGKSASGNVVGSVVRLLVFGMNVNNIGSGPVAIVTVVIAPGTPLGTVPVAIANIAASDALGAGVKVTGGNGSVTVVAPPDTTPPVISNVTSSGITYSGATINWTTGEASDTQVEYGPSLSYGSSTVLNGTIVTSHAQALSGLTASTTYHYRVKSKDAAGNQAVSGDYTFATPAAPDTTPPVISGVASSGVTYSGATIGWTTDEGSDTQVEYGPTLSYGSSTVLSGVMVTSHAQALSGLTASTTYHYRVKSKDAAGNQALSGDYSFTTPAQSVGVKISGAAVVLVGTTAATITWITDVPADSQVYYGTTMSLRLATKLDSAKVTSHQQALTKLRSNTTYYFKVRSCDASGACAFSGVLSFKTTSSAAKALSYPRLATTAGSVTMYGNSMSVDSSDFTGIAIANLGTTAAALTFTAYDLHGDEIAGENVTNPSSWTLAPGEQLAIMDIEVFGFGLPDQNAIGWIDIASNSNAVAGFTLMFNSSLSRMDGAVISAEPLDQFLFSEIGDQGYTNLYVSNPNDDSANVKFELMDANGTLKSTAVRMVKPLGAVAESAVELFRDCTPEKSDYVRVLSDLGTVPFQSIGHPGFDIAGLSGIDAKTGAMTLYAPQYVVGGSYLTTLSIANLDEMDGTLMLRFVGEDGTQIGSTRVMRIAGHGKLLVNDPSFFGVRPVEMLHGFVVIQSDGPRIAGSLVFSSAEGKGLMAALPLISRLESRLVFSHVASNSFYYTGMALVNPNPTEAVATIELYRKDGVLDGIKQVAIPPMHRMVGLVEELFPRLVGQDRTSGYMKVSVDMPVAAYSLFGSRDLKILSAIPPQVVR